MELLNLAATSSQSLHAARSQSHLRSPSSIALVATPMPAYSSTMCFCLDCATFTAAALHSSAVGIEMGTPSTISLHKDSTLRAASLTGCATLCGPSILGFSPFAGITLLVILLAIAPMPQAAMTASTVIVDQNEKPPHDVCACLLLRAGACSSSCSPHTSLLAVASGRTVTTGSHCSSPPSCSRASFGSISTGCDSTCLCCEYGSSPMLLVLGQNDSE